MVLGSVAQRFNLCGFCQTEKALLFLELVAVSVFNQSFLIAQDATLNFHLVSVTVCYSHFAPGKGLTLLPSQ